MTGAKKRELRVQYRKHYCNWDITQLEDAAICLSLKIADYCIQVEKIPHDLDNIATYAKVFIYEYIEKLNTQIAAISDVIWEKTTAPDGVKILGN